MQNKVERGNTGLAVKAGIWYVASMFLVKSLSFITTPIFSRMMDPVSYGEFSNFASWQSTLLIITGAELYHTLNRAYYDFTDDYDKYISSVTVASFAVTAAVYVIFMLLGNAVHRIVSIPRQYVHIMFFLLMGQSCKTIFLARERTLYRYKSVAAITVATLMIPTLISIVLVAVSPAEARLSARIYGFYLPAALIGLGCSTVLLRGKTFSLKHCKYAFKLALPMVAHYLTAYVLTSSNTIVTKSLQGAGAAAVVSIATSALHILTVFFQALSGAVTTWLMDNLQLKRTAVVRKGFVIYSAGLAVVSIAVILLAPEVIWVLGGEKYRESVGILPGLVLAAAVQAITSLFTIILTYDKNVVKTAACTGAVAAVSVLAKILMMPVYGYQMLPYVNIAAFAGLYFINYLLVKKAGYGAYTDIKGTTAVILAIAAFAALSGFIYSHTLLRYCIVFAGMLLCLAVLYKFRKQIINSLKSRKNKKLSKAEE